MWWSLVKFILLCTLAFALLKLASLAYAYMVNHADHIHSRLRSRFSLVYKCMSRFSQLNKFTRDFIIAMSIGLVATLVPMFLNNTDAIRGIKNSIFDKTLKLYVGQTDKSALTTRPILIALDDESYHDNRWKQDQQTGYSLQSIIQLADIAVTKGSRHVFVDASNFSRTDATVITNFIDKHKDATRPVHLFLSVPSKANPCLASIESETQVLPMFLQGMDLVQGNVFIHPVAPNYYEDGDKVVRFWKLFSTYRHSDEQHRLSWAFLPSPQLAYHAVKRIEQQNDLSASRTNLTQLPWLSNFRYDLKKDSHKIASHRVADSAFKRTIFLTEDKALAKFCAHGKASIVGLFGGDTSKQKTCVAPDITPNATKDSAKKHQANAIALKSSLLYKQSDTCHHAIDEFTTNNDLTPVNYEHMANRIIYNMTAWKDMKGDDDSYVHFTPLELYQGMQDSSGKYAKYEHEQFDERLVAIGAEFIGSRDANYLTPIGAMSGVMINLNAMRAFHEFGAVGLISPWHKFLINLFSILIASYIFARYSAEVATYSLIVLFGIFIISFAPWMFRNGIWMEFGLPLIIINLAEHIFEFREARELEQEKQAYLEKSLTEAQNALAEKEKREQLEATLAETLATMRTVDASQLSDKEADTNDST